MIDVFSLSITVFDLSQKLIDRAVGREKSYRVSERKKMEINFIYFFPFIFISP